MHNHVMQGIVWRNRIKILCVAITRSFLRSKCHSTLPSCIESKFSSAFFQQLEGLLLISFYLIPLATFRRLVELLPSNCVISTLWTQWISISYLTGGHHGLTHQSMSFFVYFSCLTYWFLYINIRSYIFITLLFTALGWTCLQDGESLHA